MYHAWESRGFGWMWLLMIAVCAAGVARGAAKNPGRSPESQPAVGESQHPPLLSPDPTDAIFSPVDNLAEHFKSKYGLGGSATYTFLNQYATNSSSDGRDQFSGRFDMYLNWTLIHNEGDTGGIGFLMRSGVNLNHNQYFNLNSDVGSILNISFLHGGGRQYAATLNVLYWKQTFFQKKVAFYFGKIHPNQFIDLSPVANDERSQFLAGPFDGNLTNPQLGNYTPGAAVEWQVKDDWYMHAMAADTQGSPHTGFSTLKEGLFYEAAEVGYEPKVAGLGQGHYRLTGWHTDNGNAAGYGISIDFDQEIGGGWVPFIRWGYADPKVSEVEQTVAGGIANIRPFGRSGDMFGVAAAWGDPSDPRLPDETLIETFYRVHVTDHMDFSPDVQVVMNPANRPGVGVVGVFGARVELLF